MSKAKMFLFSVIIPVYNAEKYLEEAVNSLTSQTIGFEDNIQVILVNDGSTDGSAEICKRYRNKYQDNIIYVEKENGGVSSARNVGIKKATGKYVNYLDADDKWDIKAFREILNFFDNNSDVRIAVCRHCNFEASNGFVHHLDYVFKKTAVIDIVKQYNMVSMSVSKAFFERELISGHLFDDNLRIAEDVVFLNKLILDEGKYGVVREAIYYYRKREANDSAIDGADEDDSYYTVIPQRVYLELLRQSRHRYSEVIPYIQYLLLTDLQWRLDKAPLKSLTENQIIQYNSIVHEILDVIEDRVILGHRRMSIQYKTYVLMLKHGTQKFEGMDNLRYSISKKVNFRADILYAEKEIIIEGRAFEKLAGDDYKVIVKDNYGNYYEPEYNPYPVFDTTGMDASICIKGYRHILKLPLEARRKYSFFITNGKKKKRRLKISLGGYARLTSYENSFFRTSKYIVKMIDDRICVYDYKFSTYIASAWRYNKELGKRTDSQVKSIRREVIWRKLKKKKPIWIISDRTHLAQDNGAAFYEYLMRNNAQEKYDIYFLIESASEDYNRLKKIGKVIRFGSREHKVMFCLASLNISSHADAWVTNPYGNDRKYYRDLIESRFVFLQHGIICNDLSKWLHKCKQNINLFLTSTLQEYKSIINGAYGYDDSNVRITGLARYDKLYDSREKVIVFAPTWRSGIAGVYSGDSHRPYRTDFKETKYFNYYNSLINDGRIINAMKENGYTGVFCTHPAHDAQASEFEENECIKKIAGEVNYNCLINRSAMLVTDYSSIAFDFAYLGRPVVYSQFDYDSFYEKHIHAPGYYNYEKDGFGPICYDYETTVRTIVELIENDCTQSEEYASRVKKTFAYTDHSNCERIYSELEKLQSRIYHI